MAGNDDLLEATLEALQRARDLRDLLRAVAERHGDRTAVELVAALRAAADEIDRTLRRGGDPTAESARARAHADALLREAEVAGGEVMIRSLADQPI